MFSAIRKYLRDELEANRLVEVVGVGTNAIHIFEVWGFPYEASGDMASDRRFLIPHGWSVNDGIDQSLCSLSYALVEVAVAFVLRVGQGALLAKVDIMQVSVPEHSCASWRQAPGGDALAI